MTRPTALAAMALLLLDTAAANAAATDESPSSAIPGALAGSAHDLSFSGRARRPSYGTGGWRCPPGFVWRQAGRTDWLCVDPIEAERIAQENRRASETWAPERQGCRPGLVPRDAYRGDKVCVEPLRRQTVRSMNAALYLVR